MRWRRAARAGTYTRIVIEVAGRDAIREAEEVVNTSWVLSLLTAEAEAAIEHKVCNHMREQAQEQVWDALLSDDQDRFAGACRELCASQQALNQSAARYEELRQLVAEERAGWEAAGRARADQSLADRDRIANAARAALFGPESHQEDSR